MRGLQTKDGQAEGCSVSIELDEAAVPAVDNESLFGQLTINVESLCQSPKVLRHSPVCRGPGDMHTDLPGCTHVLLVLLIGDWLATERTEHKINFSSTPLWLFLHSCCIAFVKLQE